MNEPDLEEIVYPNPLTGDRLWIKYPELSKKEYWLYIPTGQLIQHGFLPRERQYIELNDALKTQSICILRIKIGDETISQTIIINQN